MEFQEILTLIEKVAQSSLTSFSLTENKDGIQIVMKKEKKVIQTQKVREEAKEKEWMVTEMIENPKEEKQKNEKERGNEQELKECAFLAPMDGTFSYSEGDRMLLRVGKELNDEDGVEIGSIKNEDEIPYNLSVTCLGEVTRICIEDGQKVKKGETLFWGKVEKGDTKIDIL